MFYWPTESRKYRTFWVVHNRDREISFFASPQIQKKINIDIGKFAD